MLRPRIIPCLLVHQKGLVKTVKFKDPKYVGDPINAVKIFNEKEVDELMVVDIDATVEKRGPNFELIKNLAVECRMPFCYGGGVTTVDEARKIISLGAEKVAISSKALEKPTIITEIAEAVGRQSVVVVLDVKKKLLGGYEVYVKNGTKGTGINPVDFAKKIEEYGAGEIVINSIDQDGMMKGYDIPLIEKIRNAHHLPMTVLGGAGTLQDIATLIKKFGIIGAAAGSLFVFKGIYKAVLINYPSTVEKDNLGK
jgi:imidazole glycerol-phosphate synthase subunit HisF